MTDAGQLDLIGGHLAVDFANTLAGTVERPKEKLVSYADLVAWAEHADVLTRSQAAELHRRAGQAPVQAAEALDAAVRLRARLDNALRARIAGGASPADDLAAIKNAYLEALREARLGAAHQRLDWAWTDITARLDGVLWPVVQQAVDLLRSDELDRLAQCGGCRWMFLDQSKNRNRRWCRMRVCGAHAKMRRYRARHQDPGLPS